MFTIAYRRRSYPVAEHPELAAGGVIPWCVEVDGALYRVATSDDPDESVEREARAFFRARLTNGATPRTPVFLATKRFPVLLAIDGVTVEAWPQFVARGTGAATFEHPTLNRRVGTERGPVWLFAIAGAEPAEFGTTAAEQTLDDVRELATLRLRSRPGDG